MPSEIVRSESRTPSIASLNKDLLIVRQQNSEAVLKHLADLLNSTADLYSIPDWKPTKAVQLAFWIFDNYKYDSLATVEKCLRNPPETSEKIWRMTPDTIREWMRVTLDKEAERREVGLSKEKQRYVSEAAEQYQAIDWKTSIVNVEKLLEGFLEQLKPVPSKEIDWQEVRTDTAKWKANRAKFEKQFEKR